MKTAKLLFLLLISFTLFTACDTDDDPVDGNEATYNLCQTHWLSSFVNGSGVDCDQEFFFDMDGTGKEIITTYNFNNTVIDNYSFHWYWSSGYFRAIIIEYAPNDRILFDNVNVGVNFLSGYLDGTYAEFVPY